MIIEIGDWRVVRFDRLNWTIKHRHAAKTGKNVGAVGWYPTDRYHQTIGDALEDVYEHELLDGGDDVVSLSEAITECRRLSESIVDTSKTCLCVS
jgi:hypothetical protein